ncbi:MAG: hypothetical protein DI622_19645 [Chryseobacterium sp.]|uniref:RHS repeat-associated core domain-containing protein n=1 Tax=Chryseobacterium sp. TaxID=1871047 RepID=UPI000DB83597|nr:RHS repeat-associated core domain-containing protein [Chryseobacterium sp.]MPS66748.1 hypothetical protein [Chryseobacterium sp.]PZU04865.1 MAG: hypothetical protein DI622_19645 [Chryseobacterium sp.]
MKLRIIPTSEGYFDALRNRYFYNYTDHLGNVRLSYSDADGNGIVTGDILVNNCYDTPDGQICNNYIITGEAEGVTNYYPFGLMHNSENHSFDQAYQYKYQGQELQETGFYSFKWRNYMPDLGRFFNVDPLAEKYPTWTPYAFSGNRVIDARELEGLEPVNFRKDDGYKNLVVVVQGWSGDTKPNKTQAQNTGASNNPDFKGQGNLDLEGIGGLVGLANPNTRVVVFDSSQNENTKNDLKATISSFNNVHEDGVVVGVGHSLGADNFIESTNEDRNLKVNVLFTLDILDWYSDTEIKSSNVSKVVNYRQTNDFLGGEKVTTSKDNKTTKVINLVAPNSTHTTIDNDLRDKLRENVKRELIPD